MENQKWGDLTQFERYLVLGKVIDAMIYNADALTEIKAFIDKHEKGGAIKSEFLTQEEFIEVQAQSKTTQNNE